MASNAGPPPEIDLEAGEATHLLRSNIKEEVTADEGYEKYGEKPTIKEIFVYCVSKTIMLDTSFYTYVCSPISFC